jgi:hypothetical protein
MNEHADRWEIAVLFSRIAWSCIWINSFKLRLLVETKHQKKYGIPKSTPHNTVPMKYTGVKLDSSKIHCWIGHANVTYRLWRLKTYLNLKILDVEGHWTVYRENKPCRFWLEGYFCCNPELTLNKTIQRERERLFHRKG